MHADQEHTLIVASQGGDVKAYGILVSKYQDSVFTLCKRMLNNHEEAQDLCQDIFIKIFDKLDQYSNHSPFGAWVYRISYNDCINRLRKLKRRPVALADVDDQSENWGETAQVLKSLQERERKKIMIDAIEKLSAEEKFIVMAFYFEELSIKEIAEILGLTEGNVKVKLFRSRKFLHSLLSEKLFRENINI